MISNTRNMDLVNSILCMPEIWKEVAPEGVEYFDAPYMPELIYHLVNECDGVIIYHGFRDGLKIHPNIVKAKRGKKTFAAIEQSIQIVLDDYGVVYAEIDRELRHVTWLARQLKFALLERGSRDLYVRRKLDS